MKINKLLIFCLLFLSAFSTSCFSMQPIEEEVVTYSKNQRKKYKKREKQRALNNALMDVAAEGDAEQVEKLLNQGAKINCQSGTGLTPLHYAILCQNQEVAVLLLRYQARRDIRDEDGSTAFDFFDASGAAYASYVDALDQKIKELEVEISGGPKKEYSLHHMWELGE